MSCHSSVTARRQSQSEQVRPHREQPSISSWLRVMAVKELPEAEIKDRQDTYAPAFNSFHPSPILCDSSWPFTCLSVWALCDERQWHWSDYEMLLYWTKTKGRQHKVWRMEIYCLMQLWQPGLKVAWMWFLAFIMFLPTRHNKRDLGFSTFGSPRSGGQFRGLFAFQQREWGQLSHFPSNLSPSSQLSQHPLVDQWEVQLRGPCVPGCETREEKIGVKTLLALRLAPYLSQSTRQIHSCCRAEEGSKRLSPHL